MSKLYLLPSQLPCFDVMSCHIEEIHKARSWGQCLANSQLKTKALRPTTQVKLNPDNNSWSVEADHSPVKPSDETGDSGTVAWFQTGERTDGPAKLCPDSWPTEKYARMIFFFF